jgi:hypothetical protein
VADPGGQTHPHGTGRIEALERPGHEWPATVIAEAILVAQGRRPVGAEVGVGELAEAVAAEEAGDRVLFDGSPRIITKSLQQRPGLNGSPDGCPELRDTDEQRTRCRHDTPPARCVSKRDASRHLH